MLLNITIANFKSVKDAQTISFEALKNKRFDESKTFKISQKLSAIKTGAVIGPNGVGKSSFSRAIESLKDIVLDEGVEGKKSVLESRFNTSFAYGVEKDSPTTISVDVMLSPETEESESVIARYTLVADKHKIFEETLYHFYGTSRKLMFERKAVEDEYKYRFGKNYRGEKKRLAAKISSSITFLGQSARNGSSTCAELYSWFENSLYILPLGISSITEDYIAKMLTEHPDWEKQLINFFWSIDITDIRRINVKTVNDRPSVVFTHFYINDKKPEGYANLFSLESLSLRRLTALAIAFFESFTTKKTIMVDDFGMLLHSDVICHLIEIFERQNKQSQLIEIDCNPALLKDGMIRRDGIWFVEKKQESSTQYYSLADFKIESGSRSIRERYLQGAYRSLPILSEFYFRNEDKLNG